MRGYCSSMGTISIRYWLEGVKSSVNQNKPLLYHVYTDFQLKSMEFLQKWHCEIIVIINIFYRNIWHNYRNRLNWESRIYWFLPLKHLVFSQYLRPLQVRGVVLKYKRCLRAPHCLGRSPSSSQPTQIIHPFSTKTSCLSSFQRSINHYFKDNRIYMPSYFYPL